MTHPENDSPKTLWTDDRIESALIDFYAAEIPAELRSESPVPPNLRPAVSSETVTQRSQSRQTSRLLAVIVPVALLVVVMVSLLPSPQPAENPEKVAVATPSEEEERSEVVAAPADASVPGWKDLENGPVEMRPRLPKVGIEPFEVDPDFPELDVEVFPLHRPAEPARAEKPSDHATPYRSSDSVLPELRDGDSERFLPESQRPLQRDPDEAEL